MRLSHGLQVALATFVGVGLAACSSNTSSTNNADADGMASPGGTSGAGDAVSTGGAGTGGTFGTGGAVSTGGATSAGNATCVSPPDSTLKLLYAGYVSCGAGANASCPSSYPYYCPATNKCWPTPEKALADCGSTACVACVATICQCACRCDSVTTYNKQTTCQDTIGNGSSGGCSCCTPQCSLQYSGTTGTSGPSTCTALSFKDAGT
jgi:hypothetical protein